MPIHIGMPIPFLSFFETMNTNDHGDYSDFTTYLSSDPSAYGDCTEEEHDAIYTRLTQMIEGKFPGITVEKALKSKTTGPDELTCDAISLWIQENWMTACSDVLE